MKNKLVLVDAKKRVALGKFSKNLPAVFKVVTQEDGSILLTPFREIPEREQWLFNPKNEHIVDEFNQGLKEKADIDLGSFAQYLDEE